MCCKNLDNSILKQPANIKLKVKVIVNKTIKNTHFQLVSILLVYSQNFADFLMLISLPHYFDCYIPK